MPLDAGVHNVALRLSMTGNRWKFIPMWNGRNAFTRATLTVDPPRTADRWLAPVLKIATVGVVALLLLAWLGSVVAQYASEPKLLAWTVAASAVLAAMAVSGRGERAAGVLLLGAVAVPVGASARNWRGALMLIGVPWLVFFVARALPQIGQISLYSVDDWLTYQVAGYRIYMNGFWLEGGNRVFDYQPLYRWITGALASGLRRLERRRDLLGRRVPARRRTGRVHARRGGWRFPLGRRRGGGDARDVHGRHHLVFRRPRTVGNRGRRVRVLRGARDRARRRTDRRSPPPRASSRC